MTARRSGTTCRRRAAKTSGWPAYNVETGERTWYHLQRDEWSIHFNVTRDGTLFCGDGGDPARWRTRQDGQWIYLFRSGADPESRAWTIKSS